MNEASSAIVAPEISQAPPVSEFRPLFRYDGTVRELLPIVLVNAALNILTLTVWRFWGRTRVRRYLWSRVKLDGDPFEYSGTGLELFLGFLFVFFLILVPYGLISNFVPELLASQPVLLVGFTLISTLFVYWLIGVAIFRARRYRLSRTRWRGVRAAQVGSAGRYGLDMMLFIIGCICTLGLLFPLMRISLSRYMWQNTVFGDRRFDFQGRIGRLYVAFVVSVVLTVIALPIIGFVVGLISTMLFKSGLSPFNPLWMANAEFAIKNVFAGFLFILAVGVPYVFAMIVTTSFYMVREAIVIAEAVSLGKTRFRFDVMVPEMIGLLFGNFMIVVLTLGLGAPFVVHRVFAFVCERLEVADAPDFEEIRQTAEAAPRYGEGLAEGFDVGAM